jgi:glutamyl-tRNA reductase
MNLHIVGCSHHSSSIELRERLAISPEQVPTALTQLRRRFPHTEAVLLSTCNRTEIYTASQTLDQLPSHRDVVHFLADYHGLGTLEIFDELYERTGLDAVRHLFTVAASLDSMVVGESQILSQVKQAYQLASAENCAGPLTHAVFQASIRVAKRVARETAIHQKRVSIPSVAVADLALGIFERLDDKKVLVIGAGEMAEETLRYLMAASAHDVTMINRSLERAEHLAKRFHGRAVPWEQLKELLAEADLVISTTAAGQPVVTLEDYRSIQHKRFQRPLFILDLAVPRDFQPAIGDCLGVYLYSIDDLSDACDANRRAREKEWPRAQRIIDEEAARFMADSHHRATSPTIKRLKANASQLKQEELRRLFSKLDQTTRLDEQSRAEICKSFERLVNKLLHPPLETLRDEAQSGTPHGLIEALRRLFQLKD